jgi:hypothetical protein
VREYEPKWTKRQSKMSRDASTLHNSIITLNKDDVKGVFSRKSRSVVPNMKDIKIQMASKMFIKQPSKEMQINQDEYNKKYPIQQKNNSNSNSKQINQVQNQF